MHFRTLFLGLTAALLAILPSFAQDSSAVETATPNVIAITGSAARLDSGSLIIEGVSTVLPVILVNDEADFTYYLTNDLKTDWAYAIQIANGEVSVDGVEIDPANTSASALLTATDASGQSAIDFNITLDLTNPNYDATTGELSFEVISQEVEATDEEGNASKVRPSNLSSFVLYITLDPDFLAALGDGSAYAQTQARPSGAKPCRPRTARC